MTISLVDRTLVFPLHPKREGFIGDDGRPAKRAGAHGRIITVGPQDVHKIVVPSLERLKALGRRMLGRLFDLQLSNAAESDFLLLFFQNTAWANVGSAGGLQPSSSAGSIFVALSTGTLTATSTQSTTESAYTSYARQGVARNSGGWTKTGSSPTTAENAAAVTFPAATGGTETETNFSTGQEVSGAGEVYWYGALTASLAVSSGITPSFAINALTNTML